MTIINRKIKPHHTQELAILEMEMKWSKNVQKCIDLSKKYFQLSLLSYCHAWYILKGMNQLSRHAMFEGLSITRDCFRFRSYSCTSFKEKKRFYGYFKNTLFSLFCSNFHGNFSEITQLLLRMGQTLLLKLLTGDKYYMNEFDFLHIRRCASRKQRVKKSSN